MTSRPSYALLADGSTVEIRSAEPADVADVRQMHDELSPANSYFRFFSYSHGVALQFHRVNWPGESVGDDVVQDLPADGAATAPGADHGHRLRQQQVAQARDVRATGPSGHHVQIVNELTAVVPVDPHVELDQAVDELALDRQARVGKDPLHGNVVGQGLGGERREPALLGD